MHTPQVGRREAAGVIVDETGYATIVAGGPMAKGWA
jgi:hypothetical protein